MSRPSDSTTVPVVLWLCAAAVVHYATWRSADAAAAIGLDKMDLRGFVTTVRSGFAKPDAIEVTFEAVKDEPEKHDEAKVLPEETPPDPNQKPTNQDRDKKAEPEKKDRPKDPPKDVKEPKDKPKPPDPPRIKLPEVRLDPPKPEDKKPDPPKPEEKKPDPPPPKIEERPKATAVDQHVEDKDQKPNPSADKIAEHNNHVKEETRASITNNRVNDKETNPGAAKSGDDTAKEPGNAEKSRIADTEDKAGTNKAPGDSAKLDKASESKSAAKDSDKADAKHTDKASPKEGNDGRSGPKGPAPQDAKAPQDVKPAEEKAPPKGADAQTAGDKGTYSVNPFARDPKTIGSASAANSASPPVAKKDAPYAIPKLGGGPGPNGVNFNLSPGGALAVFGEGALKKERELDGERRKSAHRGKWKPTGLDRIKQQIENYVAHVKLGDTTALNTASVPFAKYLNHIHNQLHPIFADEFLSSLDGLPSDHPANNQKIRTVLEVVIDKDSGKILESGIVKTSGVTMFDIAALDAMDRAAPFGKPPDAILSPDGKVYLHWEFHRAPEIACTTHHAFPFILKEAPPSRPEKQKPLPGPRVPLEPRERGITVPSREGRREDPPRPDVAKPG